MTRRRGVMAWAGLLGLAGCLAVVGAALLGAGGLQTSADVAQLVSVVLAVSALAAPLLPWRRAAEPVPVTADTLATAMDVLAGLIEVQWRAEATMRSLDDPDPIPVRWHSADDARLVDHPVNLARTGPLTASSADVTALAGEFRAMRRRRLVILGGPGSGKTTLAVQLLRELVATRQDHDAEPIPVLLSVAGWDTTLFPRLQDWLASRLAQDYPALRATGLGVDVPALLASRGLILPILDGLDELPLGSRAAVVIAINRSLSDTDQLVVTSRTADYRHAVDTAGDVLTSAMVIEPDPVDLATSADYLRRCLPARPGRVWERVLTSLSTATPGGPAAVLAEVTSTPLGLWLLRTVYLAPAADPADLLDPRRFPTASTLRTHLFDRLIPALIDARPPSANPAEPFRPRRRHDPTQMRRRLGYLARLLTHPHNTDGTPRTRDLAWWHLARTTHALNLTTRLVIAIGITLAVTTTATVTTGIASGVAEGLTHGLGYGLAFGLVAGLVVAVSARFWSKQLPGFADLRRNRRPPSLTSGTMLRGMAIGVATGIAMGIVVSLDAGRGYGLAAGTVTGLAVGFAYLFSSTLTAWAESPTRDGQADTPTAAWRADRALNLLRTAAIGVTSGLCGGLAGGFAAGLAETAAFGGAVGLTYAVTIGPAAGLVAGRHHAWMAYLVTTTRLALAGELPRQLMSFLDDAHRLGLLRVVGPIYQFRHAELQDHLASDQHTPADSGDSTLPGTSPEMIASYGGRGHYLHG
ncbi:NACHT domain-containing protein [Actinoplanes sp. NPDC051861]|uniref:NACHT domain-containing protein n=1 Tax=Actinoplanes sp. NPDC051861 TaxID=3155170 RepID=UPI0034474B02